MYKTDEKGTVHTIQFAAENFWITDLASFYSRKPSELNIEALEETVVLQIGYDELIILYTQTPKFNLISRKLGSCPMFCIILVIFLLFSERFLVLPGIFCSIIGYYYLRQTAPLMSDLCKK